MLISALIVSFVGLAVKGDPGYCQHIGKNLYSGNTITKWESGDPVVRSFCYKYKQFTNEYGFWTMAKELWLVL